MKIKKILFICVILLFAFMLVSCDVTGEAGNTSSSSDSSQNNLPSPPESSYELITGEGDSFDIPETELELLDLNEGEGVLKFFMASPMRKIGNGEQSETRTNMAEIINKSQQIYSIYNNKIDIDDNDPELDIDQKQIVDGKVEYYYTAYYHLKQLSVFLNYVESYVDLFASVEATKDLKDIELLDVYLIWAEMTCGEGIYIYFVTNYGEYIFYRQSTFWDVKNEYLFPSKFMYTLAPKLYEELRKHSEANGYHISGMDIESLIDMSEYIVGGAQTE